MNSRRSRLPFRRLERREIGTLLIGLAFCGLLWAFLALGSEVSEGDTTSFDTRILVALRKADDPSKPIGPAWMEPALLDITALGSPTVLGLVVLAVTGFMVIERRFRTALLILATAASGDIASWAIKRAFDRTRPSVVPHLREVLSPSFPSGHAMESAIIYLTLGAMLMHLVEGRLTKVYCMTIAILATMLVGTSRVFLGVHYPTDVIGGWMFGFLWASLWWLLARQFEGRAGVERERHLKK